MAFIDLEDLQQAYDDATKEADQWRIDYPEYERLGNNGLLEDLDENLPEVNDGSLAASLFKLSKRVIRKKMAGRFKATDRDDPWITELANLQWENNILKNAKSKASPRRKWKDAVRKAAIYGSQPIITLFVDRNNYNGADFIVPHVTDVKLEAGKDSDEDSDIIFWDIYYSITQVKTMIEQATEEMKEAGESDENSYNKWDIETLQEILDAKLTEPKPGNQEATAKQDKGTVTNGIHFYIAFQRGVNAPFYMCHSKYKGKPVREWSNPDPTGDVPVHYLYCYQDFVNPYGIGIVKLAGGTQNVLDYMRQADVLATQLGLRRPRVLRGDTAKTDFDSMTYTEDAIWEIGDAQLDQMDIGGNVYSELPGRISMYQTSLQKMIPMGDTSISGTESGDSMQSKTPAGVKLQAANLSIDDDDFMENVDECYEAVSASMINTHFANMQGTDLMKLTGEERDLLAQAGIEFPIGDDGQPSSELEILWDEARTTFSFKVDSEADKTTDDATQLEGLMGIAEFITNPNNQILFSGQPMILGTKRLDPGELVASIIGLSTDNDKILTDITPEEMDAMAQEQAMQPEIDPATGMPVEEAMPPEMGGEAVEGEVMGDDLPEDPEMEQMAANVTAIMEAYNVDEELATAMYDAEQDGATPQDIQAMLQDELAVRGQGQQV